MRYSPPPHQNQLKMRNLLVFCILLLFLPNFTESCLPSWFRQTRSAADPLNGVVESDETRPPAPSPSPASSQKSLETNEIEEILETTTSPAEVVDDEFSADSDDETDADPSTLPPTLPPKIDSPARKLEEMVKELVSAEKEAEYEYEYVSEEKSEEEEEALKYNEEGTTAASTTLKPAVRKEIEKLKEEKCRDYCHHNATCHVEVIFHDDRVSAVVPSCHCPHGWEGTRCDRHYVQAFYAPVSRYNEKTQKPKVYLAQPPPPSSTSSTATPDSNGFPAIFHGFYERILQSSTSAVPAFAFLIIMLIMFIAIVVYAYRRMSKRADDTTYTMSHMCPPEAFTVLKTPNGRKISVHQCSSLAPSAPTPATVTPAATTTASGNRIPMRQAAVRSNGDARSNFFSILRSQGTIPSRAINDDDTPKHYKSVPRVEVSAINYSGHIDFSSISFQSTTSEVSKASATCPPPAHFVIEMEDKGEGETNFRSPSRSSGEPGSPTTCEPMIVPPK